MKQNIELQALQDELQALQEALREFDKHKFASDAGYAEWLDELYPDIKIGYSGFQASRVLAELDPIAYRCGFSDYVDSMEDDEFPEYRAIAERIEELEDEIEALESEIEAWDELEDEEDEIELQKLSKDIGSWQAKFRNENNQGGAK